MTSQDFQIKTNNLFYIQIKTLFKQGQKANEITIREMHNHSN